MPGLVDITPPGRGDVEIPTTRLRVPGVLRLTVEPAGEGAEYTPVHLTADVVLHDQATGRSVLAPWFASFEGPHVGDWRYAVAELHLTGGGIIPATLTKIRLSARLRRALRGVVLLVKDEGGFAIDPSDFDERAVAAYVTAQLVGDNPTSAVAAELGVKTNAAAQRVSRLRKAGRLPAAAKKGKP